MLPKLRKLSLSLKPSLRGRVQAFLYRACYFSSSSTRSRSPLLTKWNENLSAYKNNIAVIQDEHQISYEELDFRVNCLCHLLQSDYNLNKGDTLLHLSGSRLDNLQILLACSKLGVIYTATNPFSQAYVATIATESNAKIIINEPEFDRFLPYDMMNEQHIHQIVQSAEFDTNQWLAQQYQSMSQQDVRPHEQVYNDDICNIIFTSGTTGVPKGCLYSHDTVYHNTPVYTKYSGRTVPDEDYTLVTTSIFGAPGAAQRWSVLLDGSTIVYPSKHKLRDVAHWHDLCENKHPQISRLVAFARIIADFCPLNKRFNQLKAVLFTGDFISFKTVLYLKRHIFNEHTKLIHGYGSSETFWISLFDPMLLNQFIRDNVTGDEDEQRSNNDEPSVLIPAGTPIDEHTLIKLNEKGEILVKKTDGSCMVDYLNAPSPFDIDGYINTGDLGFFDEATGLLYLYGRSKDIIKDDTAKYVYPIEIECIVWKHSDVEDVAVVGYPNSLIHKFKSGEVPVAFVVLKNKKRNVDEVKQEILALCKQHLDPIHMIRDVYFLDAMAKAPGGKLDKNALRKTFTK